MDTQTIDKISLTGKKLDEARSAFAEKVVAKAIFDKLWVKFNLGYYVPKYEYVIGDPVKFTFPVNCWLREWDDFSTRKMTYEQAKDLYFVEKEKCPFIEDDCTIGKNQRCYIACNDGCVSIETGEFRAWHESDTDYLKIPTIKISKELFFQRIFYGIWKIEDRGILEKFKPADGENIIAGRVKELGVPKEFVDRYIAQNTYSGEKFEELIEDVLTADEHRAGIERYDRKCVEDVNLGHWELWNTEINDGVGLPLERKLVARNPLADIHNDGLVGIDFGTKSTIVSYQDGNDIIKLHRVGMGQLSKKVRPSDYENPTVIEFIDIESFLNDYFSIEGRPLTSLEDLTVSHKAYNSLKNSETSDDFYSFFYDIKQWCGDSKRYKQIKIVDKCGFEHILPPYLEIKEGELDPVEIYAYYLGLYINNMRNGIFLNYSLSFPVSYRKDVKQRLLRSFERGLKKSLPNAVIKDSVAMERFKVTQGISEPAAYAICALKSYGFDPQDEDEKYYYGIFDFGGGTTDFDFGVWRGAADTREERRYDYVINHFGAEGDQYLGGENLLELMAYEVFKANQDLLLPDMSEGGTVGFSFFKPTECDNFAGSEVLISSSQEAKRNTKQLMEALRPIWEQEEIEDDLEDCEFTCDEEVEENDFKSQSSIIQDGYVTVDLYDKNGERHPGMQLYIENPDENIHVDLYKILEDRIDRGVANFFEALKLTFKGETSLGAEKIHIFLAGNSSKSPLVKKCFEGHILKIVSEINDCGNPVDYFEVYPPLGTQQAYQIQKQKGIEPSVDDFFAPTGKTGVALGLIEGRNGGPVKVISEISANDEIKFSYYIGRQRKKKFKVVIDREVNYNKWIDFGIPSDETDFELYYSTLPEVSTNDVDILGISKKLCRLENTDPAGIIFVRAISPDRIEYCAALSEEETVKGNYISNPVELDLSI